MPCGVTSCSINDDRFLWKCEFCNKKYHAACVGVQRQREHFITAFMVPMCADCQDILRKEADVRKLLHQQEQLVLAIQSQTDANHRIAADLKKFCLVGELFDSIEHLLNEVKATLLIINNNNENICTTVSQHMKSYDTQMHTTITGINESNSMMSQQIATNLDERLTNFVSSLTFSIKGAAESSSPHHDDSKLLQILEEMKFMSGALSSLQTNTAPTIIPSQKTLEDELKESPPVCNTPISQKPDHSTPGWRFLGTKWHWRQDWTTFDAKQRVKPTLIPDSADSLDKAINDAPNTQATDDGSGWRFLGTRMVYKADWSQYDQRKLHRQSQQKQAEKARKRKKLAHKKTHATATAAYNQRRHTNKMNHERRNHGNLNPGSHNNSNNQLPPDRVLLAAAKERFSRPPTNYRPTMLFQRGEILNPYPESTVLPRSVPAHSSNWMAPGSTSAASRAACSCRHPGFQRN